MKLPTILTCLLFFFVFTSFAQQSVYNVQIQKSFRLYQEKDYLNSAKMYSVAFKTNRKFIKTDDYYNSACSWALAGVTDSSFRQLFFLINRLKYDDLAHISSDADFTNLHGDPRWNNVLQIVRQNLITKEKKYNKQLKGILDSVYNNDQKFRMQFEAVFQKYGYQSEQMKKLRANTRNADSLNQKTIESILKKYGWIGADIVGENGNSAIFLVIQHANLKFQEKYLPLMKQAVKNKKASSHDLALLEDRVSLDEGKKQIYGTQMGRDEKTKKFYILPLEDPDHVDDRRAKIGLPPIAEDLGRWSIIWNVKEYKKQLPQIEALQKGN